MLCAGKETVGQIIKGRIVAPGIAKGEALVTRQPISFCLGVDAASGRIIDARHELCGQSIAQKILVFPFGKGSSGAGLVILELIRTGLAPAAMINIRTEPVVAIGAIIARYFYKRALPMMCISETDFFSLKSGQCLSVDLDAGRLTIIDEYPPIRFSDQPS